MICIKCGQRIENLKCTYCGYDITNSRIYTLFPLSNFEMNKVRKKEEHKIDNSSIDISDNFFKNAFDFSGVQSLNHHISSNLIKVKKDIKFSFPFSKAVLAIIIIEFCYIIGAIWLFFGMGGECPEIALPVLWISIYFNSFIGSVFSSFAEKEWMSKISNSVSITVMIVIPLMFIIVIWSRMTFFLGNLLATIIFILLFAFSCKLFSLCLRLNKKAMEKIRDKKAMEKTKELKERGKNIDLY